MAGYVSLQDVTKTYKMGEVTIKAADGISFDVEKGEFVIVVGPSGAGKTTVLNILGGMDTATSGKVLVDGAEISKYRGKKLIQYRREDIGFVFQFYNLMQNLTALENVELAMQICKHPLDASEVLEEVGLEERMNNFPAQLSGGEQQRVGLARALVNNPSLIIADEPTGNVDPNMSYEIVELLTEINRRGTTVIMVTHEHQLVRDFGRRVIMIENGTVVADNYMPTPQTVPEAEVIAPIPMSKEPVTDGIALSAEQERTLSCEPVPQAVPAAPNVAEYAAEETAFVGPTVASDEKAGDAQ